MRCFQYSTSAAALAGCSLSDPAANGRRIPSTAEEVLADTHKAESAAVGERRKGFDLDNFTDPILVP